MQITSENAWNERASQVEVRVPRFMEEIVEEISRLARTSGHVNQASGVSVRMSIANYENMISNAERRAIRSQARHAVVRISDLAHLAAGSRGKLELNMTEESGQEDRLIGRIAEEAIKNVFDQNFKPSAFKNVVEFFEAGNTLETGDRLSGKELLERIAPIRDFARQAASRANELEPGLAVGPYNAELTASLAELILEGLHCHNRLNKRSKAGAATYGAG